ncbi:nuclear transport factor 2 family protein [Fischerella sp. PCC 9605]|uniref:nuclear transport factor 2 family protein n=1 Tax=Fischerella sp. PCC 9605 TaxID=1173024 RepID=UPI0004AE2D11|nr:nuclear transport factor 2 family protein [Fischerella sp. PCC 9605]
MNVSAEAAIKPEIPNLIHQAKDAWVALDGDALAQLFTLDGELIVPGQKWQGQAKIREAVSRLGQQSKEIKIDIQRIIISGDQAVVEWHYEETEKATNHHTSTDDAIVIDFQDGRISRWREYFDTETPSD